MDNIPRTYTPGAEHQTLSAEHLEALRVFAKDNGRSWKSVLNDAWSTGNWAHDYAENAGLLQEIRNIFGPSWLVKFSFANTKTHSVNRPRTCPPAKVKRAPIAILDAMRGRDYIERVRAALQLQEADKLAPAAYIAALETLHSEIQGMLEAAREETLNGEA